MAEPDLYQDHEKWTQVSSEHQKLRDQLDTLYTRWENLSLSEVFNRQMRMRIPVCL